MRKVAVATLTAALISLCACGGGHSSSAAEDTSAQATAAVSPAENYNLELVRRAGPTAEDGKVYFIQDGRKRWVISAVWIIKQGCKWPDDVKTISAEELAAIPEGAAFEGTPDIGMKPACAQVEK